MEDQAPSISAVLDRRLDRSSPAPLAVGFSGGSDSLALLALAKAWADASGRKLLALTVDHGLDPSSAEWTAKAGEEARRMGAEWRALAWRGEKPARGRPAAARDARYRLMSEAMRDTGAKVLLAGHTADDAAESELMRAADAPALGDLKEWAPLPVWPEGRGQFLLRPLLSARRAELRAWLAAQGLSWLEDPSNADPAYARARARRLLAAHPERGSPAAGAPFRRRPDQALAELGRFATATFDGRVVIAREFLRDAPYESARRFVAIACLCAAGHDRPPRTGALERLLEQILASPPFVSTLAGARVVAGEVTVVFAREAGERARGGLAPVQLSRDHPQIWDGRFEVRAKEEALTVAALAGHARRLGPGDREWLKGSSPYARPSLPAILSEDAPPALPAPFGHGPAEAHPLAKARLAAACGLVQSEAGL